MDFAFGYSFVPIYSICQKRANTIDSMNVSPFVKYETFYLLH